MFIISATFTFLQLYLKSAGHISFSRSPFLLVLWLSSAVALFASALHTTSRRTSIPDPFSTFGWAHVPDQIFSITFSSCFDLPVSIF